MLPCFKLPEKKPTARAVLCSLPDDPAQTDRFCNIGVHRRSMALIVFFRGINVGGHRTFRPSMLARELGAYDVVNVGAAGTLVVRKPGARTKFLAELRRKLPLERKSRSATGVILSSWKWRIRLELSHYDRRLFDLSASCQELVAARLPFRSQFPKVASGLYELSGRKIDLCLECTGVT
jgi:hypothetical protein